MILTLWIIIHDLEISELVVKVEKPNIAQKFRTHPSSSIMFTWASTRTLANFRACLKCGQRFWCSRIWQLQKPKTTQKQFLMHFIIIRIRIRIKGSWISETSLQFSRNQSHFRQEGMLFKYFYFSRANTLQSKRLILKSSFKFIFSPTSCEASFFNWHTNLEKHRKEVSHLRRLKMKTRQLHHLSPLRVLSARCQSTQKDWLLWNH